MKRKNIIIVMIILLIVLIGCVIALKKLQINRNSSENLEYINSDELDEGTISPDMIHVVIALYQGEINPKAISKATYHFINHLVPEYLKKCKDEKSMVKYFERNREDIELDIGIKEENEFITLMNEINKLSGKLEFESARFDKENIKVNSNNTKAELYIKYKNNEEICVNVKILNKVYANKTSIQFSK